jgi:hypothetical protein
MRQGKCCASLSIRRTPAISGSRPSANHNAGFYRESAALLRSAALPQKVRTAREQQDRILVIGGRSSTGANVVGQR